MLLLTLIPVDALSEYLAVIVDFGIEDLGLPEPLGGLLIAILVVAPEGLTAFHAALANHLQRAVNVCLGSALSTIGLTIPAVLIIGFLTNRDVHLGLSDVETVLLVVTLFVSGLTFAGGRTNVLQGRCIFSCSSSTWRCCLVLSRHQRFCTRERQRLQPLSR